LRGFNQADEIAVPVARHLNVPLLRNVRRVRATPFQSGLSARERATNLRRAFMVRGSLSCRHVLIVDDVITTGTTVRQLAKAVLQAGACRVSVLAVARA
jgi:ComF family protein